MKIAKRLSGISASPTMMVMQEAQELRARGIDVVDLGPGQPDFPTPDPIKKEGLKAIEENFTNYTPAAGIKELRRGIADSYNKTWGTRFGVENVTVTCGAKHAIYNACTAVFQEGDEVLNPAPYWVTFPEVIKMCGALPVDVPTLESNQFIVTPDDLEPKITTRTRGLIVNTPNNPTGAVIPREETEKIIRLGQERGLFLLFDETYEHFVYGDHRHTSLAALLNEKDDDFAIVGSFSKTYAMTGWRIGYCVGPASLIRKINQFQSHQTGNPTSISQKAALAALASGTAEFSKMRDEYEKRRDFVLRRIEEIPGFSCARPDGAFYLFPNVVEAMEASECPDSAQFSKWLIQEARVATVPGSAFGAEGYIRISYATSMENLEKGMDRIQEAIGRYTDKILR